MTVNVSNVLMISAFVTASINNYVCDEKKQP